MTRISDALVYLWGDDDDTAISQLAAEFTSARDAHLTGVFVVPEMPEGLIKSFQPPKEVRDAYAASKQRQIDHARAAFEKGVSSVHKKTAFFSHRGNMLESIYARARCSDVVIIRSQRDDSHRNRQSLFNEALIHSGAPFLILPPELTAVPSAKRVVIAWNGSREASLAVRTSMDILRAAEVVVVVNAGNAESEDLGIEVDLCEHLSHHGVNVEAKHSDSRDVAEVIEEVADDIMADLVVCGAWGHIRLREMLVGGVTHKLLHKSPLALWTMH